MQRFSAEHGTELTVKSYCSEFAKQKCIFTR